MSSAGLPDTGPFRVFPTRGSRQAFADDAGVCSHCLGGSCCQSEDAIYLTAVDILRLCTFLDLSPPEFLRRFTQDRFAEGPLEPYRRQTIDDPDGSVVTYLRRRSNRSYSPCIFLKYVREADGTPRRICGVHAARPLACREYYHHHCKTRATGELAALQARTFEMIRDGAITIEMAHTQRGRLRPLLSPDAPMSAWLEYAVWTEALRALQPDEANEEGTKSYPLAAYQDPIDDKINRLLSKRLLRLEERYGWIPHNEQLHVFTAGGSFAGSPDHQRFLRISDTPPSRHLFDDGDYPFFAANRLMVRGMRGPRRFRMLGKSQAERLLNAVEDTSAFASHRDPLVRATSQREIWIGTIKAADALVTFAGYVASLGHVLEVERPGTFESALRWYLRQLQRTRHPLWARHPGLTEVANWADSRGIRLTVAPPRRRRGLGAPSPSLVRQLLDTQLADGSWADPAARLLPSSQAEYLHLWLQTTATGLLTLCAATQARTQRSRCTS